MLNKLKFAVAVLLLPLLAFAQSYPSPTFQNVTVRGTLTAATPAFTNPVPVSSGGTNLATLTAHGVMLGEGTSSVAFAGPSATAGLPLLSAGSSADPAFSTLGLSALSNIGANTLVGNATGSSAAPTAITVAGCNGAAQALQWTNGSGFQCNSSIATSGANANITSLSGLTTPLSVSQGGIGAATLAQYNVLAGNGASAVSAIAPSTAGFVLTSNGVSAFPTFQALPSGRLIGVQKFTSSGTYTPSAGATSAIVMAVGGGGGGGGGAATSSSQVALGGQGCSGSWGVARITSLSSQTVTIGASGGGGAAGANAGTAGGQTSIGTWLVAPGGGAGVGGAAVAFATTTVVGAPGTQGAIPTSSGTLLYGTIGSVGSTSVESYNGSGGLFGAGGTGPFGAGGFTNAFGAGANGSGFGAGGSGAFVAPSGSAAAGGNGSAGFVLVFEYN